MGIWIIDQMKAFGILCEIYWLKFTMDEDCRLAIAKMLVELHNDGLIYRYEKMVNYDPIIRSALSDQITNSTK